MNRTQTLSALMALALLVTGVTFAAAPAAAADADEPTLSSVFDRATSSSTWTVDSAKSGVATFAAGVQGFSDRAWYWISNNAPGDVLDGDEPTASEEAKGVTTYYRGNNETLEAYVNQRENFSSNRTVEVTWHLGGETATRYLLANASDGNVTTKVVKSTSRTPDEDLELCGYAAERSLEELKHFTENYAQPNKDVSAAYKARIGSRYGDDVQTSLYPSDGSCGGGS